MLTTRQKYYTLFDKVEEFGQRYECSLDDWLHDKHPPKVSFPVYQQTLKRLQFLKQGPYKPTERLMIDELQYQLEHPQKVDADGYARINYQTAAKRINMSSSTPPRSIRAVIEQSPISLLDCKWKVPEITQDGKKIECLYAKATVPNLLTASMNIELEHKRKQGGNQYQCQNPDCLSTDVRVERRLVCNVCGHTSKLDPTYPNGKLNNSKGRNGKSNLLLTDNANDTANATYDDEQSPDENFLPNDAQPVGMVITSDPPLIAGKLHDAPDEWDALDEQETQDVTAAAELLQKVAGEDEKHIEMSREGEKKYYTMERPLTFFDLVDHLRGGKARGALCSYQDGHTRAQCFDRDDAQSWEKLRAAAQKLVAANYSPLLEESPASRGGHLWIIYSDLVDAVAARTAVLQIAPELADCVEYWPKPASVKGNRVRLPGGKYIRRGHYVENPVEAWCKMFNAATGESSNDGLSAARLLLTSLTPADLVPPLPPIYDEPAPETFTQDEPDAPACIVVEQNPETPTISTGRAALLPNKGDTSTIASAAAGELEIVDPEVDARWEARYGKIETTTCWFAVMPEVAAQWYNERNPLESIRPVEPKNRMALSPNGNERTPSTNYRDTPKGERYTDFSTHGLRPDGTHDSGDALELAAKVEGKSKSTFLVGVICEMINLGKAALESAAVAGQPLPSWFFEPKCIITRSGRRQYAERLAAIQGEARAPIVTPAPVMVALPEQAAPETFTQDEPDAPACIVVEQNPDKKPALVEGMKVETPAGIATVAKIVFVETLKVPRWRCAVYTDQEQPDLSHFAVFDAIEVRPISQSSMF